MKFFKLPLIKLCSSGIRGQGYYYDVEFINWSTETKSCGSAKQHVIGPWKGNSDFTGFSEFIRPVFNNVVYEALTYIKPPSQGWVNWEDCGIEFTCTGLYNVVARFVNSVFQGSRPSKLTDTFTVTSNNAESTSVHTFEDSKCEFIEEWNAFLCDDEFGILIFDSLDEDRMDRSAQPIYVTGFELDENEEEVPICKYPAQEDNEEFDRVCFDNRLNAYMDMCWDGFYTCQKREQRFVSMVWLDAASYEITYTGTPPENQRFILHGDGLNGFVVRISYSNAGAYAIYDDNDNVIEPTEWDVSA